MKIPSSAPHFFVRDIRRPVRFYVDLLGFDEPRLWGDPPTFAMPSRDGFIVMLNQSEEKHVQPNGAIECWGAYFWCDDIDEFWREVQDDVQAFHGPEDREDQGTREIAIAGSGVYTADAGP